MMGKGKTVITANLWGSESGQTLIDVELRWHETQQQSNRKENEEQRSKTLPPAMESTCPTYYSAVQVFIQSALKNAPIAFTVTWARTEIMCK